MNRADTVAERQEYLDGGLVPVACGRCPALVRAKKLSPQQTSVQWTTAAARHCVELAAAAVLGRPPALVPTCPDLRESIDRAVRDGRLEVP
jgi:hypothetical protein